MMVELPDSVLLIVFKGLDAASLLAASQLCSQWYRVALDNSLWHRRFLIDYKLPPETKLIDNTDDSEPVTWLSEYKQLYYCTPCIRTQHIHAHKDEVLHVSFASNGRLLASTSKDALIKLWSVPEDVCSDIELSHSMDMYSCLRWHYTQYSQFNRACTKLLVSGVQHGYDTNSVAGEIAVFDIIDNRLNFRCRVYNRPYDVFGCWFNDTHLLSGEHFMLQGNHELRGSSVSHIWLCQATPQSATPVLAPMFKFLNVNYGNVRMLLCSDHVTDTLRQLCSKEKPSTTTTNKKGGSSVVMDAGPSRIVSGPASSSSRTRSADHERVLIFSTGCLTSVPHIVAFKLISARLAHSITTSKQQPGKKRPRTRTLSGGEVAEYVPPLVAQVSRPPPVNYNLKPSIQPHNDDDQPDEFVMDECGEQEELEDDEAHNVGTEHLDADQRLNLGQMFDAPDHSIDVRGHVCGIALSHDRRFVLVNYRAWLNEIKDDAINVIHPPEISDSMSTMVIDLSDLSVCETPIVAFKGHKGFTPNHSCFFIFNDANEHLVVSGSEDHNGYLWSRKYGCVLQQFAHTNVVNACVLSPHTQQPLAVTVSDDQYLNVYRSRQHVKLRSK